jgi:periplasmic protein CpxP/Spy
MKKIFSFALFLGLAFGLNTAVSAQQSSSQTPNAQEKAGKKNKAGKRGNWEGKGNRAMGGLNRLNLTDAQKQQIQNIRQSNQAGDAVRTEMRQLMQAQRGGTLTAQQSARLETLKQQSKDNRERQQQQIMAVLTPEQRQQYEQMKSNGKQRRQNRQSTPQSN